MEKPYDEGNPKIDRIALQGDAMTVSVCTDNPMIDGDLELFLDALRKGRRAYRGTPPRAFADTGGDGLLMDKQGRKAMLDAYKTT